MSFLKAGGKALADVVPGLGHFTFDPSIGTVFVTSGTGVIGYRVALSLLEFGHKSVRVGIWKGERQVCTVSVVVAFRWHGIWCGDFKALVAGSGFVSLTRSNISRSARESPLKATKYVQE